MTEEVKVPETAPVKKCAMSATHKKIIAVCVIIIIALVGYGISAKKINTDAFKSIFAKNITPDQAKAKLEQFIKDNGGTATVKSVTVEGDLYKVTVNAGNQDVVAYMTKDGSKFFPQAIDFAEAQKQADAAQQQAAQTNTNKTAAKSDVPDIRLFVMSYCPYGTQMEKGILPAVAALGNKIKFTLEFVDYSMHNDKASNDRKELDENLRQYCIQKNEPAKLSAYLTCFLQKGQGTEASCMASAGVNATQVASCMAQTDTQFDVAKDFNDQSTWSNGQFPPFNVNKDDNVQYGVQGSPTLVINGTQTDAAGRDSASLLKTICSAFNNPPAACNNKLSSTAPAAGFGGGTAAAGSNASCATK